MIPRSHYQAVKRIYWSITGNEWTERDDQAYLKVKGVPLEIINNAMRKVATERGPVADFASFVGEILKWSVPTVEAYQARRQQLEEIVLEVRGRVAMDFSLAEFLVEVKRECARRGIVFDNNLFNQIVKEMMG